MKGGIDYATRACAVCAHAAFGYIKTRTVAGYYCELHFWAIWNGNMRPVSFAPSKQQSRLSAG